MSSFTRGDYERTFRFALSIYYYFEDTHSTFEEWAIQIMNQCEEVIGQMSERPRTSRRRPRI